MQYLWNKKIVIWTQAFIWSTCRNYVSDVTAQSNPNVLPPSHLPWKSVNSNSLLHTVFGFTAANCGEQTVALFQGLSLLPSFFVAHIYTIWVNANKLKSITFPCAQNLFSEGPFTIVIHIKFTHANTVITCSLKFILVTKKGNVFSHEPKMFQPI